MKFITSFYNKKLLKNNLGMYWVLSLIWGLYLFFMYAMPAILVRDYKLTSYVYEGDLLLGFGIPLAFSLILFHFMKSDAGVAFHYSLPMTRTQLFFSNYLAGAILFLIPLMFNFAVISLLAALQGEAIFPLFQYLMVMALLFFANYSVGIFMGSVTGSVLWQIIFLLIFYGLPSYIMMSLEMMGRIFLYGFSGMSTNLFRYIDIVQTVFGNYRREDQLPYLILFLVIYALVMGGLSYLLFRKKKMEENREWIGFYFLKPIFIVGVASCTAILFAGMFRYLFFGGVDEADRWTAYLGGAIGAALGYVVASMISQKTIYLKKVKRGMVLSILITVLTFFVVDLDLIGFERKIPASDSVESVVINDFSHLMSDEFRIMNDDYIRYGERLQFFEQENIESVQKLHRFMMDDRRLDFNRDYAIRELSYYLKNDQRVVRSYPHFQYDLDDEVQRTALLSLIRSKEYREQKFPVWQDNFEERLFGVQTMPFHGANRESWDGAKQKELLAIIRREIEEEFLHFDPFRLQKQDQRSANQLPISISFTRKIPEKKKGEMKERIVEDNITFYGKTRYLRDWLLRNSTQSDNYVLKAENIEKLQFFEGIEDEKLMMIFRENPRYLEDYAINDMKSLGEADATADIDRVLSSLYDYPQDSTKPFILVRIQMKQGVYFYKVLDAKEFEQIF